LIDLHSHILPGIDDGARNIDIAVNMAQQAVDCGVTHMVCTPHIHQGYFDNNIATIEAAFLQLKNSLKHANIPLSISFAAEVRVNELIPQWIKRNELPFLGSFEGKNVLLLEMPHSHVPPGVDALIKWLLKNGVQPIIAHPERNRELLAEQHKFNWLKRTGCKFQVTAGALTGRFGEKVQQFAHTLMHERAFHVVASDTHDTVRRPNDMAEAFQILSGFDAQYANEAFIITPAAIVGIK
jgi:protein-tyrosine phosphatase